MARTVAIDGGQFALYGGWDNTVWYDRAILSFGWYGGSVHRDVTFEGSPVDPHGSPDGNVVSFYNELGRRFDAGSNTVLTPYLGLTLAHAELNGFTESDPHNTGAALKVSGSDADSVASVLGLRVNGTWGAWRPELALGWEHEFANNAQTVHVSFAGAAGSNFSVVGTDVGADALVLDAGTTYVLDEATDISVRYVGRWQSDYDAQSVMGRFTLKFGVDAPLAPKPLKLGD